MATFERTDRARSTPKVSAEILDRQPPRSLEAEKAILGSILLAPNACDDVALVVRPDDFYDDANRTLYTHLREMHDANKRIDITLLVERLKHAGDFETVGGNGYLAEVMNSVATAAHAIEYAEVVRDKSTLRSLIYASTEVLRDAYDAGQEPRELLSGAEQKIFAILERRGGGNVSNIRDILNEPWPASMLA